MKKKYKKQNNIRTNDSLPVWNLSDLYSSISSKKIKDDLNIIEKSSKLFSKKYEGKVAKLDSNNLLKGIKELENIDLKSFLLLLINNSFYKKDIFIKEAIFQYIEFYFLKMINKNNLYQMNYNYKRFIEKVHNMNTYNLDQESFFIDIKKSIFNG